MTPLVTFISWAIACILVAMIGKNREIGFWWSFALSFVLSPIIGLIFTFCSRKKKGVKFINIK